MKQIKRITALFVLTSVFCTHVFALSDVFDLLNEKKRENDFKRENVEFESKPEGEVFSILHKTWLYEDLKTLRDDFLPGISEYTNDEIKNNWEQAADLILHRYREGIGLSTDNISDFYVMEKEMLNSLLDEKLYDHKSLRKIYDDKSAENIVLELLNNLDDPDFKVNTDNDFLRKVYLDEFDGDTTGDWLSALTRKVEYGLEQWNALENSFIEAQAKVRKGNEQEYYNNLLVWEDAYEKLKEEKENWLNNLSEKMYEGEKDWEKRLHELEEKNDSLMAVYEKEILDGINQRREILVVNENLYLQTIEMIETSKLAIDEWFSKWKEKGKEIFECWNNESDENEVEKITKVIEAVKKVKEGVAFDALDNRTEDQFFLSALTVLEEWAEDLLHTYELRNEQKKRTLDVIREFSVEASTKDTELEKLKKLKSVLENQLEIDKAVYEYSQNRTASQQTWQETQLELTLSKEAYQKTVEEYENVLLKVCECEQNYEEVKLEYEKQKLLADAFLIEYENLLSKYNNLKYEVSLSQMAKVKSEFLKDVDRINNHAEKYNGDDITFYLQGLKEIEYENVKNKGNELIVYLTESQEILTDDGIKYIPSIAELKKIIETKTAHGESSDAERQLLNEKLKIIDFIETGKIKDFITEAEKNDLISQYGNYSIEYVKLRDIEAFKIINSNLENIYEYNLDEYSCSDYVRTVFDIYKNELYEKQLSKDKIDQIVMTDIGDESLYVKQWLGSNFVYKVISGYENFVNEEYEINEEINAYYESYNTEKNKYSYLLDCLDGFCTEYINLTREYHDLISEAESVESQMKEAKKKYDAQVLLTKPGSENSYYDMLERAFRKYDEWNQILLSKYEKAVNAELEMNKCEAVNNWAESTYLHLAENYENPELAYEKSKANLLEIEDKIKSRIEYVNSEKYDFNDSDFDEFTAIFKEQYDSKLKGLELYNKYISLEEMIKEESANYENLFSKIAKDCSFEDWNNITPSDVEVIKSFVAVKERYDDASGKVYDICFNSQQTVQENLDYLKEYINQQTYTDDFSYLSQSRLDAAVFLQELETKEYDLNDLMLAVCYLKGQNEEECMYFEGEDPYDENNYPFQLPVNKLFSMDFVKEYADGRLSEIEKAYNKIILNNGLDDVAKYIFFSSFNMPAEYQLKQREIDVIATRALNEVITKIDGEAYKHIINGVGLSIAAAAMGAMAAIPMIGAWAIVPASAALMAAATAYTNAASFTACGDDARKIRNGYKIILDEYEYYYDSLVDGCLTSKNKLDAQKNEFSIVIENIEYENSIYSELTEKVNELYFLIADEKNVNSKLLDLYTEVYFNSGDDLLVQEGFDFINDFALAEIIDSSKNSIDLKDYELYISKIQLNKKYENWKRDMQFSSENGNNEWNLAEKKLQDAFAEWQIKWLKQFDENNNIAKQRYAEFLYEKEKWVSEAYLNETLSGFEEKQIGDFFDNKNAKVCVDVDQDEIRDIIDNTIENISLFEKKDYLENYTLGSINHNLQDDFNSYRLYQDTYSFSEDMQNIVKGVSSRYSAQMAQKLLDEKINEIYAQINSQNESVDKWQKNLVLKDGYSIDGEIWRDAVIDSLVFNTALRKRQTVHKYEWFTCVNPFISEAFDNYSGLDSDAILTMINNSMNQIDEWSSNLSQAFIQHIGEAPEFVEHVDIKKGRFENISKNGSGEMGIIMLDYIWNSLENAEGYAQLGTPLYDKKFTTDNTFLGIKLPTIRQITDIVCDIAANATEQMWLKVFDDAVYALMDMSLQTKTTDQILGSMGKAVASLGISYASSAASDALSAVENGVAQFLGNAAVSMTSTYLTDVSSSYIDAMSFENGFSIDWDRANSVWLDPTVLKRTASAGATYGVRTAANYGLNRLSGVDGINVPLNGEVFKISAIKALNNSLSQFAASGTEFAITGKTTLNLIGTKEVGIDLGKNNAGFFGITFDENGVSAAVTSEGSYIGLSQIIKSFGGVKDALKVAGIKMDALSGNMERLSLLNAANALGYSGVDENITLAQRLWNNELKLVYTDLKEDELGYYDRNIKDEISVNKKYAVNSKEAAVELATVLSHEGTHVNGNLLEALAHEAGLKTYLNLTALYGNDIDSKLIDQMLEAYCNPDSWGENEGSVDWWKLTANGQILFDKKGWLVDENGNKITDEKGRSIGHNEILAGLLNILYCGNENIKSHDLSYFNEEQKEYAKSILLDALISYSIKKGVPDYSGNQFGKKLDMDSIMQNCGNTVASEVFYNYYNNLADLILAQEYNVDLGFSPDKTVYPDSIVRFKELLDSNRETTPDADSLLNKYKFTFISKDKTEYELFKLDKTNPYADQILKQYDVWLNSTINNTGCAFMSVLAVPQLLTGRVLTAKEIEDIWNIATSSPNPPVLKNAAVMDANELSRIVLSYMGLNDFKLEYVNDYKGKEYKNRTLIGERVKVDFNSTGHTTLGNIGGEIIYNPHNTATEKIRRDGVYIYD